MAKKNIALVSVSPSGKTYKTSKGKIISKKKLLFLIKFNLAKVVTASGGEVFKHKTKVAKVNHKKGDYIRTVPNYKMNDNISSLEVDSKLGIVEKKKKKSILIGVICGLFALPALISPIVIYTSRCAPTNNGIIFNHYATNLAYGESTIITAHCTSGDVTLSASGDGRDQNWEFDENSGELSYTEASTSPIEVTITASSQNVDDAYAHITLNAYDGITIYVSEKNLHVGDTSDITAICTTGNDVTLSAAADISTYDADWEFVDNHDGTGTLTYESEVPEELDITITASSQNVPDETTEITLFKHNTINITSSVDVLNFGDAPATFDVSSTSGDDVTLSAEANIDTYDNDWNFKDEDKELLYVNEIPEQIIITITAKSDSADDAFVYVTLNSHDTIHISSDPDQNYLKKGDSVTITAYTDSGNIPSLAASSDDPDSDTEWEFNAVSGELTYTGEVNIWVNVTVTATSPNADPESLTFTLQPVNLLTFEDHPDTLAYGDSMQFVVQGTLSEEIELSAEGDEGDSWGFVDNHDGTGTLYYDVEAKTSPVIVITANADYVLEPATTSVTLELVNTISVTSNSANYWKPTPMTISTTVPSSNTWYNIKQSF